MLIFPPWTLVNIIFHVGFAAAGVILVYSDYYDKWAALHYSKFSKGVGIPTRQGCWLFTFCRSWLPPFSHGRIYPLPA
jgi:hypothetical protein